MKAVIIGFFALTTLYSFGIYKNTLDVAYNNGESYYIKNEKKYTKTETLKLGYKVSEKYDYFFIKSTTNLSLILGPYGFYKIKRDTTINEVGYSKE